ncbi:MAG: YIP1 family protein [Dehalococcoidia bacterium]
MRTFHAGNLPAISGFVGRLLRLDFSAFDDVRSDPATTTPALLVVGGASFLAGLGSWIWALQEGAVNSGDVFVRSVLLGSILQVLAWLLWVYVVYQILARIYGAHVDFYEMIRVMGFAFAPVGLTILIGIQSLAIPLGLIFWGMTLLLTNASIQTTTTADNQQVTVSNLAAFAVFAIVMGFLANVAEVSEVGGLAPGLFFFSLDF